LEAIKIPFKAGIKAGDQILAIDGKPTQGLDVQDASKLIRGKVGTRLLCGLSGRAVVSAIDTR